MTGSSIAKIKVRPGMPHAAWLVILALVLLTVTLICFGRWLPDVWFGDDLSNYHAFVHGDFASSPLQSIAQSFSEKYRPVFALLMEALFSLFGSNIRPYLYVNVAFNVLSGLWVAAIAYGLTGGNRVMAATAAIMTTASRFALYQVTQVTGLLEGTGYFLFLIMLWASVELHIEENQDRRRTLMLASAAIVAEWLLVFTHERYLTTTPWVAAMIWLAPGFRRVPKAGQVAFVAAGLAAFAANLAFKIVVLREAIFVGTGGTHIGVDWIGEMDRLKQAILSILRINDGPAYLVGYPITEHPFTFVSAVAVLFVALLGAIVVRGLLSTRVPSSRGRGEAFRPYLIPSAFVFLIGLVLVPPVLTIRMEQRWLVEPFTMLVLTAVWFAGELRRTWGVASAVLLAALAAASLVVDQRLTAANANIFFVYSETAARNIKAAVVDSGAVRSGVTLLAPPDICDWVMLRGEFFRLYAPAAPAPACLPDLQAVDPMSYRSTRRPRIFETKHPDFTVLDVTEKDYAKLRDRDEIKRLDLLSVFDKGRINDTRKFDTPAGTGAFLFDFDTGDGAVKTLTIVSPFAYSFDHIAIKPGDRLKADAVMIYPTREQARVLVTVAGDDGKPTTVLDTPLPLRPAKGPAQSVTIYAPLDGHGPDVSVTIAVKPTGGDMSAQWVAFDDPRIVGLKPAP